ncbi:DUF1801 domain-containing protein [Herbiconiux sp. CPCC 203407]|uniref:DUF1801 domain-containing protein n=1 Tax=Herbiconiux oxytropis TaxID=2970915 RepID=A0AA41XHB7_9MICO|nr:DUF1801 domain-containing protein [Herbiconiux oxytropis]MCS5722173.1 DUF1801 domain-containing protein [Herbiconiux oxytropis]MCS5725755.1 DUF1801 domain-containing protein [Herbiconiux oxytropis]
MSAQATADDGFSAEERAAIKERAAELKAQGRSGKAAEKAAAEAETMSQKIAGMPEPDRGMAERLHEIVTEVAPDLAPKLFYGQPAWTRGGKPVVFFRSGQQDKERYSTLGFSSQAALDDESGLWPTSYALSRIDDASAATIADLVKHAAG